MAGTRRIVVVGADGAGMSAAHEALRGSRRRGRDVEVVALEATGHTSYSRCGVPYYLAGDVDDPRDLVARTAEEHREKGVDLRLFHTVEGVDRDRGEVTVRRHAPGEDPTTETLGYDDLVLTTGASPVLPEWTRQGGRAGAALVDGASPAASYDDGLAWQHLMTRVPAPAPVVVVGGGYIGLETAEALRRRGYAVTVLSSTPFLPGLDRDQAGRVRETLEAAGVEVRERTGATGLETDADGWVSAVGTDDGALPARLAVLALGVRPATRLGADAGLDLGESGGYLPDDHQRLADGVWAAGDCCESVHRLTGARVHVALGTHANKQGKVVGDNLGGGERTFPGVIGTSITRFEVDHHLAEVAATGLRLEEAEAAGLDAQAHSSTSSIASGYMPDPGQVHTTLVAERGSGRLLGAQVVGGRGSAKRIDTLATAIWAGLAVGDLAWADLSYAPPFSTAWEAVQVAARQLESRLEPPSR